MKNLSRIIQIVYICTVLHASIFAAQENRGQGNLKNLLLDYSKRLKTFSKIDRLNELSKIELCFEPKQDFETRQDAEIRNVAIEDAFYNQLEYFFCDIDTCNLFIKYGGDINSLDKYKLGPLHYAVINNNIKLVQKLIDSGAYTNLQDGYNRTPLHYAVRVSNKKIVELLLLYGVDFDIKDNESETPLHYAARQKDARFAQLLFSYGANGDIKNDNSETAISIIANHDSVDPVLVEELCKIGVNIDQSKKNSLPINPLNTHNVNNPNVKKSFFWGCVNCWSK